LYINNINNNTNTTINNINNINNNNNNNTTNNNNNNNDNINNNSACFTGVGSRSSASVSPRLLVWLWYRLCNRPHLYQYHHTREEVEEKKTKGTVAHETSLGRGTFLFTPRRLSRSELLSVTIHKNNDNHHHNTTTITTVDCFGNAAARHSRVSPRPLGDGREISRTRTAPNSLLPRCCCKAPLPGLPTSTRQYH
jgi:hypothetical protein